MERRNNNQFVSGLKMVNHEVQSVKISLVKELTSPGEMNSWRFQWRFQHSMASEDFKNKNGNVQQCVEFEWNF